MDEFSLSLFFAFFFNIHFTETEAKFEFPNFHSKAAIWRVFAVQNNVKFRDPLLKAFPQPPLCECPSVYFRG